MSEHFVALADVLRPQRAPAIVEPPAPQASLASAAQDDLAAERLQTLRAVRRFRAALDDALDAGVAQLLASIASEVLARELSVSPADVAAVVANARRRIAPERAVAVRIHPQANGLLAPFEVETILDPSLAPGDVIVVLQTGSIDLRLATRLELAVAACRQ